MNESEESKKIKEKLRRRIIEEIYGLPYKEAIKKELYNEDGQFTIGDTYKVVKVYKNTEKKVNYIERSSYKCTLYDQS